mgnify:CR=1 FL=1
MTIRVLVVDDEAYLADAIATALNSANMQATACYDGLQARSLIDDTRPDVIVADEPTGALDSEASGDLLTFLRHCVDDLGQTVVMVTHDHDAAARADDIVTVTDGQVSTARSQEALA